MYVIQPVIEILRKTENVRSQLSTNNSGNSEIKGASSQTLDGLSIYCLNGWNKGAGWLLNHNRSGVFERRDAFTLWASVAKLGLKEIIFVGDKLKDKFPVLHKVWHSPYLHSRDNLSTQLMGAMTLFD